MKLTSSIFATLLAFTYSQNDTITSTLPAMDMTSTMLYTSSTTGEPLLTETLSPKLGQGDDPTKNDDDCPNFYYMGTLVDGEDIELSICGYTEGEDDDAVDMVGITVSVPADVWVAIGMKGGMYDSSEDEEVLSGYNIIIPLYSRDFQELYYQDNGDVDELQLSLSLYSDVYEEGMRVVRFLREAVVDYTTLGGDDSSDLSDTHNGYYFDFDEDTFVDCKAESTFSAVFADKKNTKFDIDASKSSNNKFGNAASPEEVGDDKCDDESSANYIPILVAFFIGILAILF